ncbi:MAG: sortase [Methanobacterium sp.]|uniref:sortase domain-containing protein n=1 Tax=Methanobacterium sp. TaxID=2164 RepID=UPI003D64CBDC|nr:sortase [Methanobacterium sp.]
MNRYLLVILALVIFILFATGSSGNESQTKHFDNGEISFDYPGAWNGTNGTAPNVVTFTDTNGMNVTVLKLSKPSTYNLAKSLSLNAAGTINQNFQLVSSKNVTVNGIMAYELEYNVNGKNGPQQRKEVWFEKNNVIYCVIYTAPGQGKVDSGVEIDESFGGKSLESMITSFNIKDGVANPTKSTGWAEISIPDINANWKISSYSINTPGAVYHIPTSYFPGEKGEMSLMGHRTTHHAPFLYIYTLKPGNLVIIKDNLTQKKYTYQVESNGDVRWGAKGINIKYQPSDEPKLLLVTCHPPGFSRAAWIVHCKLVSVEPLS